MQGSVWQYKVAHTPNQPCLPVTSPESTALMPAIDIHPTSLHMCPLQPWAEPHRTLKEKYSFLYLLSIPYSLSHSNFIFSPSWPGTYPVVSIIKVSGLSHPSFLQCSSCLGQQWQPCSPQLSSWITFHFLPVSGGPTHASHLSPGPLHFPIALNTLSPFLHCYQASAQQKSSAYSLGILHSFPIILFRVFFRMATF